MAPLLLWTRRRRRRLHRRRLARSYTHRREVSRFSARAAGAADADGDNGNLAPDITRHHDRRVFRPSPGSPMVGSLREEGRSLQLSHDLLVNSSRCAARHPSGTPPRSARCDRITLFPLRPAQPRAFFAVAEGINTTNPHCGKSTALPARVYLEQNRKHRTSRTPTRASQGSRPPYWLSHREHPCYCDTQQGRPCHRVPGV